MKTESEVAEILSAFDASYKPYGYLVRGVSVWRLIRASVGSQIRGLPMAKPTLKRSKLFIACVRSIFHCIFGLKLDASYAVMSYTSALRIMGNSGFEDIYFQELLENRVNGIRLYSVNTEISGSGHEDRSYDCTAIYFLGALLAKILPVKEGLCVTRKLCSLIHQHISVTGYDADHVSHIFSSFFWQSYLFRHLLRSSGIKTVIAADNAERALIHACRMLNIRFVELQHGVFNPTDPDCVPSIALTQGDDGSLLLPNSFAQYGDYWIHKHSSTAMGELGRISAVGSHVIERYFELRKFHFSPDLFCPVLVVTTQGLDSEGLRSFIADFLSIHRKPCVVQIKLHPIYDRSTQPYIEGLSADPRVQIIEGNAGPNTYELIALADLHISIASACHYDALGIGTPTGVLNLHGSDVVQDLIHSGNALYIQTPADLDAIVSRRSWGNVPVLVSNRFFKRNFLANISHLMD
jgi:hypothetical protein